MKFSFGIQVSGMSIFGRVECTEMGLFAFNRDLGKIFPSQFSDAKNPSAFIADHCLLQILKIYLDADITQITNSVVRFAPIYVVDAFRWKISGEMQPCKSMRVIPFPVNAQDNISSVILASSNCTGRASACSFVPRKDTSLRIVGKKLVEPRLCKHVAPHQSERHPKSCSKRWMKPPVPRRVSCQSILQ